VSFGAFVLRNIVATGFRSAVILTCVALVAGFALFTALVTEGSEQSLSKAKQRLGADILVVPKGSESRVQTALLSGRPTTAWMPKENLDKIAQVSGVQRASAQLYLASLSNASCCAVSEMFLLVFDPATDFTLQPWLEQELGGPLKLGDVVGGTHVFVPEGDDFIMLYGYFLTLKATLEATGTGLDQTMFMTIDTARDMARISLSRAEKPLEIPPDSISAVLVKTADSERHDVAQRIQQDLPGVAVVERPDLFQAFDQRINILTKGFFAVLGVSWAFATLTVGLIFSMSANERRREIGVMRALGSPRHFALRSLLAEAALLAGLGAAFGLVLTYCGVLLFHDLLASALDIYFVLPSVVDLGVLLGQILALSMASVAISTSLPAFWMSSGESVGAMRARI
jgi:putative ABC transport system permease protein